MRGCGRTVAMGLVGTLVWGAGSWLAQAAQGTPDTKEKTQTIQGEIVDPAAYLKDSRHGTESTDRTYEAVDGGQTLAIVEEGTGLLYLLLAEEAGEDPNELAYDYANQQVKVTGRVYERGGMRGIAPTAIEPIVGAASSTEVPAAIPESAASN